MRVVMVTGKDAQSDRLVGFSGRPPTTTWKNRTSLEILARTIEKTCADATVAE